jgi:beta-N-acetylhexosaminidase
MLAFTGTTIPAWLEQRLAKAPAAGVTLFRAPNLRNPAQVRRLTTALQAAAGRRAGGNGLPLLIAADQEGGQLLALGDGFTQFGGPMAIGATGDPDLAERVGRAIGTELRAVGVNVDYAPVLDVASNPANPAIGIRSFGDEPAAVGRLAAAWLGGLQGAGVAGAGKHFPGAGAAGVDTHHELAVLDRSRVELEAVELGPFRAAIAADVRLVMSGHFASPALTGSRTLPATLSRRLMGNLLRDELGFGGVTITDALDMHALPQDATQTVDVLAALAAGVDLLLATPDRRAQRRIEAALRRAAEVELLGVDAMRASESRIDHLRRWLAAFEVPALDVVGAAEHAATARELAERSLTLVRDEPRLLPLRLASDGRVLAIMPAPLDLTPADTSSYVRPGLAVALRHHASVDEIVTSHPPTDAEVAAILAAAGRYDAIVVGTISAARGSPQAGLVAGLLATGRPVVTVALRTPWDLGAYPGATTHVCTYSILPESMEALGAALFGAGARGGTSFPGRLPVTIEGVARRGQGRAA